VFFNNNQAEAFESDDVTIMLDNVKRTLFWSKSMFEGLTTTVP